VRSLAHGGQLLLGEGHGAVIERDQVKRQLMTPLRRMPRPGVDGRVS
jgi:hypothetical protein